MSEVDTKSSEAFTSAEAAGDAVGAVAASSTAAGAASELSLSAVYDWGWVGKS